MKILFTALARDQEILTDPSGSTLFPMYRVCIESFSGEILKDYQAEGYYVTGITVDNGLIELKRVQKTQEGRIFRDQQRPYHE